MLSILSLKLYKLKKSERKPLLTYSFIFAYLELKNNFLYRKYFFISYNSRNGTSNSGKPSSTHKTKLKMPCLVLEKDLKPVLFFRFTIPAERHVSTCFRPRHQHQQQQRQLLPRGLTHHQCHTCIW